MVVYKIWLELWKGVLSELLSFDSCKKALQRCRIMREWTYNNLGRCPDTDYIGIGIIWLVFIGLCTMSP